LSRYSVVVNQLKTKPLLSTRRLIFPVASQGIQRLASKLTAIKPQERPVSTRATKTQHPMRYHQAIGSKFSLGYLPQRVQNYRLSDAQIKQKVDALLMHHPMTTKTLQQFLTLKQNQTLNQNEAILIAQMISDPTSLQALEARKTIQEYSALLQAELSQAVINLLILPLPFEKVVHLSDYFQLSSAEKNHYIHAAQVLENWFKKDIDNDFVVDHGTRQQIEKKHEIALHKLMDQVAVGKAKLSDERLNFYFENKQVDQINLNNIILKSASLVSLLSFVTIATWNGTAYHLLDHNFHALFGVHLADSFWDGMEPFSAAVGSFLVLMGSVKAFNLPAQLQYAAGIGGRGTKYINTHSSFLKAPSEQMIRVAKSYGDTKS